MSRLRFILLRLGLMIFSIWVVITLVFIMFRVLPGDPTAHIVSPEFTQQQREQMLAQYGLDQPLHVQYYLYIENMLRGDLGQSFQHNSPVLPFVLDKTMNTIIITVPAILLSFTIGPLLGAYFAWHRNERIDTIGSGLFLFTYAAPMFWTGMLAIMLFSFHLGWLPSGGMRQPGVMPDTYLERYMSTEFLRHAIMPLLIFFMWRVSLPMLVMRNNMLDVLGSDFIELKRAIGLSDFNLIYKHAARNALLPVLHYAAIALGFAFGGSVILETVFSWPGIGLALWQAVFASDYPVAQASFILISTLIIVFNFLVDIVSVFVDPRVTDSQEVNA